VPNFLMNTSLFVFSYATSFYLSWKLALVAFLLLALLVIPGLMYGWILMGFASKLHTEYNKSGIIVEQALSSIRTMYCFVGEKRTLDNYSTALDELVKLGVKQGLTKGLATGSNGASFAIWSFLSWYASRLVIALGTALPNLKYFSAAFVSTRRISEMNERVPDIDCDDNRGEVMEKVYGELDFKNVGFAYPSRPHTKVLHNFYLIIPGGQTVALVGSSGSGKSIVIALLERFYDPDAGDITIQAIITDTFQRQSEAITRRQRTVKATAAAFVRKAHGKFSSVQGQSKRNNRGKWPRRSLATDGDEGEDVKQFFSDDEESQHRRLTQKKRRAPSSLPETSVDMDVGNGEEPDYYYDEEAGEDIQSAEYNQAEASRESTNASPGNARNAKRLAWGKGDARSHTNNGSVRNAHAMTSRTTYAAKMVDYLLAKSRQEKETQFDIHFTLLPFEDEEKFPSLKRPYLSCQPTVTVKHICK
ncbi:hypothetical protein KI387_034616, partial [Taxus chinensis]